MDPLKKISTPSSDPFRSFIAVEVAPEYGQLLESTFLSTFPERLQSSWRMIPRQNYHLTLVFLGNLPVPQLTGVADAMLLCRDHQEFTLQAQQIDFLNPQRGDLLAALYGGKGLSKLDDLQLHLATALPPPITQSEHKAFRPHITLTRRKRSARPTIDDDLAQQLPTGLQLPPLPVSSVTLFESRLTPGGSIYRPLFKAPLS